MAAFFPLLLSRKRAQQDTEQLQLWAAKQQRTKSQMFLRQMNKEMEEAQVFARCGVLLSLNERKERGQNEPQDGSWWSLCLSHPLLYQTGEMEECISPTALWY